MHPMYNKLSSKTRLIPKYGLYVFIEYKIGVSFSNELIVEDLFRIRSSESLVPYTL